MGAAKNKIKKKKKNVSVYYLAIKFQQVIYTQNNINAAGWYTVLMEYAQRLHFKA